MMTRAFFLAFLVLFSATIVSCEIDFHDPDETRNVTELITSRGYGCEDHTVTTEDGYILSLQRILPIGATKPTGEPVYLQHGLLDSAATFVINYFPSQNLALILSDAGYDVWLANSRGNTYSTAHVSLDVNSNQYWNFSFDEMAKYDLPACVDYILTTSNKTQLSYVGHSQGTLMMYVGLSLFPDLMNKIKVFQALAPVTFLQHMTSKIFTTLAELPDLVIYKLLGRQSFGQNSKAMKEFTDIICNLNSSLCDGAICELAGCESYDNYNQTRLSVLFSKFPAGTSVKNMVHWKQLVGSDKGCTMYKYLRNKEHYGTSETPVYDVTAYTNPPMAVYSGGLDKMADPQDVNDLIEPIQQNSPESVVLWNKLDDYGHGDFVWGLDAYERVYADVVDILDKYN